MVSRLADSELYAHLWGTDELRAMVVPWGASLDLVRQALATLVTLADARSLAWSPG